MELSERVARDLSTTLDNLTNWNEENIAKAQAVISRHLVAAQWQPLESAPMDGNAFLAYGRHIGSPLVEPISFTDYLLSHLAQECCEVAIRCTKAQHFGLDEIQPGQPLTNRQRIQEELCDLLAIVDEMKEAEIIEALSHRDYQARISAKLRKAAEFRDYSRQLGRLR